MYTIFSSKVTKSLRAVPVPSTTVLPYRLVLQVLSTTTPGVLLLGTEYGTTLRYDDSVGFAAAAPACSRYSPGFRVCQLDRKI